MINIVNDLVIGLISGSISSCIISLVFLRVTRNIQMKNSIKEDKYRVIKYLLSIEYEMSVFLNNVDLQKKNHVYEDIKRKVRLMPIFYGLENASFLSNDFFKSYSTLKLFMIDLNNEFVQGFSHNNREDFIKEKRDSIWKYIEELQKLYSLKKK